MKKNKYGEKNNEDLVKQNSCYRQSPQVFSSIMTTRCISGWKQKRLHI